MRAMCRLELLLCYFEKLLRYRNSWMHNRFHTGNEVICVLSVREAAKALGVSETRVRALLKAGLLEGEKLGRAWTVSERSVSSRLQSGAKPGRPRKAEADPRPIPDIEAAHRLYDEAQRVLTGCYDARLLDRARTPEEQAFWIRMADFFLQQRQQKIVGGGSGR